MAPSRRIGNIPPDLDAFVGRDAELSQLQVLHAGTRLLTLLGPAGVGKTRLALRLAARVGDQYPDGVWFIDVAAVVDAALLPIAVARILGVRPRPGESGTDALIVYLRQRQALLILDTCERMLDACAALACSLRDKSAHLRVLVISREVLNTTGDAIWRTPPLSVPASTASPSEVALAESVHLLVVRAREHDRRFTVTRGNSAQIAEVCRRLGGLPLALELVAARLSSRVTPRLPEPDRPLPLDREHILRTALEWAQTQLAQPQQVLFRRLSVFAGTWDVSAAKVVCGHAGLSAALIETGLGRLVTAALVVRSGADRYRMLDAVRDFALERLRDGGEEAGLNQRLLERTLSLVERVAPEAMSAAHADLLETELDNIRAALDWAIRNGQAEDALRLATAASSLWYFHGYFAEGCEWLERALRLTSTSTPRSRARAAAWLGQLLQFRGEYALAEGWLKLANELHTASADPLGAAFAAAMLGQLLLVQGDLAATFVVCADAAARLEALGHPMRVASRLQVAVVAIELGNLERAADEIRSCAAKAHDQPRALEGWLRFLEGRLAAASGDTIRAAIYLTQALELARTQQEQTAVVTALVELGNVHLQAAETARARNAYIEAIEVARRSGERFQLMRALEGLASTFSSDQPATAVRMFGAADRLRTLMGARPWPTDRRRIRAWLPTARRALTRREYRGAWSDGQSAGIDQVLAPAHQVARRLSSLAKSQQTLTPRERQIVALLARALTNEQIAAQLAIRPGTARTHVEHIMLKLGLHRRAQLVLWANQHASDPTDR